MNEDIDMGYPVEPPAEVGTTLGEIFHGRGHEKVRVSLERSNGPRPVRLVRIQPFRLGQDDGKWWPRPSFTLRLDQIPEMVEALDRAPLVAASDDAAEPRAWDRPRLAPAEPGNECNPYDTPDPRRGGNWA